MLPAIIYTNLTDQLMGALCSMLMHSLWQGLLLAATGGLIVTLTKKVSPTVRYNLLTGVLLLFVLGAVVTFVVQLNQSEIEKASPATVMVPVADKHTVAVIPLVNQSPVKSEARGLKVTLFNYINTHHNTIVLIWFLIISAKSIQFGVGLQGAYLLKRTKVIAAGNSWQQRIQQLAARLGITQTINLLESGMAKVPMVVGHLKPVILMPIGLLTALSMDEIDAILVHELAHIKRRDYLVNLLQSLAEILFFFNPAVLWISQLIKTERENCCDDMALAETDSKINYLRALVSCEEYQATIPAFAMCLPGNKNTLANRVKRIISNRNHSLNMFEKGLLTICLVISGLCLSAFAEKEQIKQVANKVMHAFAPALNKTDILKLTQQNNTVLLGQIYSAYGLDTIKKAQALNQLITINQPVNATYGITTIKDTISGTLNYTLAAVQNMAPGSTINTAKTTDSTVRIYMISDSVVSHTITRNNQADTVYKLSSLAKIQPGAKLNTINKLSTTNSAHGQLLPLVVNKINPVANLSLATSSKAQLNAIAGLNPADTTRNATNLPPFANKRHQLILEMVKDGIIEKEHPAPSYSINDQAFIVNGKKQPDEVFKKYHALVFDQQPMATPMEMLAAKNMHKILADLASDGIIATGTDKSTSFKLNSVEFIVNGQKQPDAVFEKYYNKYIKNSPDPKTTLGWNIGISPLKNK